MEQYKPGNFQNLPGASAQGDIFTNLEASSYFLRREVNFREIHLTKNVLDCSSFPLPLARGKRPRGFANKKMYQLIVGFYVDR